MSSRSTCANDWIDAKTAALVGSMAFDEQLAERSVAEDRTIRRQALRQDLPAVRDEQKAGILHALPESTVVKRRDQGLSGGGSGHYQVAVAMVPLSLCIQAVKHLALEWPRLYVDVKDRRGLSNRCRSHSAVEAFGIPGGVIWLVVRIRPITLESGPELLDEVWCRRLSETHVPFDTVEHGAVGQIG